MFELKPMATALKLWLLINVPCQSVIISLQPVTRIAPASLVAIKNELEILEMYCFYLEYCCKFKTHYIMNSD